jgi:hypothetical protein
VLRTARFKKDILHIIYINMGDKGTIIADDPQVQQYATEMKSASDQVTALTAQIATSNAIIVKYQGNVTTLTVENAATRLSAIARINILIAGGATASDIANDAMSISLAATYVATVGIINGTNSQITNEQARIVSYTAAQAAAQTTYTTTQTNMINRIAVLMA